MTLPDAKMLQMIFPAGGIVVAIVWVVGLSNLVLRKYVSKSGQLEKMLLLPPGPRPLPLIGNLASLGALPHRSLQKLANTYGPLMYLRLGSVRTLVVSSTEMAEQILKTHDKVFASRPHLTAGEIMAYGSQAIAFLPYGDEWLSGRKLFTTKLVTGKRILDNERVRKEEILLMLRSVVEKSERGVGEVAVPMSSEFFHMAANIITRLMFSKRIFGSSDVATSDGGDFRDTVMEVFRLVGTFNLGDYIPFLKRFDLQGFEKRMRVVHKKLDRFLQSLVDARLEDLNQANDDNIAADDIMTALLTLPCETTGKPRTGDQIKAMMVDVLLAGTDSTSITLEWALSELLKNPAVMRIALEELDRVVGRARLVDESDLPRLPYLQAVVKETLRLHPAGALMVPHESTAACKVGEYFVPAQTRVIVNVWAIGRDPAVWEHALQFWPSRFLPEQVDANVDLHGQSFKLLPFGSGRRGCPAKALALRTLQYTLAVMIQACHWTLPASTKPEDLDMSEAFAMGVYKAVELEVVATPRLPASVIGHYARDEIMR